MAALRWHRYRSRPRPVMLSFPAMDVATSLNKQDNMAKNDDTRPDKPIDAGKLGAFTLTHATSKKEHTTSVSRLRSSPSGASSPLGPHFLPIIGDFTPLGNPFGVIYPSMFR